MLFFLGDFQLIPFIAFVIVVVFAFAYHELGHAVAADRLGDPTPRNHGRMTLNPIPHLSLVGFLMIVIIGFGWAVTPVQPAYFKGNRRTSWAIVAVAGPAMNLLMAIIFAVMLRLLIFMGPAFLDFLPGIMSDLLENILVIGVRLNLFLIAFNLLPIPPLDGYRILSGILPYDMAAQLQPLEQYGMMIFFVVIFLLPRIGLNIFPLINSFTTTVFNFLVLFPSGSF